MDIGAQTLAQLSEENKEAKYITIETGSKISGYTRDYLERLCRLNKVDYRLWSNGAYVIELESLLRETHTILLSYEGITFVEKSELTDPIAHIVVEILTTQAPIATIPKGVTVLKKVEKVSEIRTQSMPRFGGNAIGDSALSFVGRAVLSDSEHPGEDRPIQMSTPILNSMASPIIEEKDETPKAPRSVHLSISGSEPSKSKSPPPPPPIPPKSKVRSAVTPTTVKVQHATEKTSSAETNDEWDKQLLLGDLSAESVAAILPVRLSKADIPSPYRPIKTSLDATEHHDDGLLFPPLKLRAPDFVEEKKVPPELPASVSTPPVLKVEQKITVPEVLPQVPPTPTPPVAPLKLDLKSGSVSAPASTISPTPSFTAPAGQKVLVFAPGEYPQHVEHATGGTVPKSEQDEDWDKLFGIIPPDTSVADLAVIASTQEKMINGNTPNTPAVQRTNSLMKNISNMPVQQHEHLPMKIEEHHLSLQVEHQLIKSAEVHILPKA